MYVRNAPMSRGLKEGLSVLEGDISLVMAGLADEKRPLLTERFD
jgi:hypothetical protein